MPVHDWTRVDAGTFHAFHHLWIGELTRSLRNILPPGYYALPEQILGALGPDVLTLQRPSPEPADGSGGVATAPAATLTQTFDPFPVKQRRKQAVIRHKSGHRLVAVIEVVSPGNKSGDDAMSGFRDKALLLLQRGIHLMILDLFPPGLSDPDGVSGLLAETCGAEPLPLPPGRDRLMASYRAGRPVRAFIEPVGVGAALPELPLYLHGDQLVRVPLEQAYGRAFEVMPDFLGEELGG
ncbi:MAG: DUF4058 family protein [Gemmataceae bacterium]